MIEMADACLTCVKSLPSSSDLHSDINDPINCCACKMCNEQRIFTRPTEEKCMNERMTKIGALPMKHTAPRRHLQ